MVGCSTLVSSILGSLTIYFMSLFFLPTSLNKSFESRGEEILILPNYVGLNGNLFLMLRKKEV